MQFMRICLITQLNLKCWYLGNILQHCSSICFSKSLNKKVTDYVTWRMPAADLTYSSELTEKQSETTPYGKTIE